jgi:hypothetical protein
MTSFTWRGLTIGAAVGLIAAATVVATRTSPVGAASADPNTITVYKTSTCGCCKSWVSYLQENGFTVVTHDLDDAALTKLTRDKGVPDNLASCHTAVIGGYVVEGHVPAADIKKMLADKPAIVGLSVPGMVQGSPGMPGPSPQHYNVVAFDKKGGTQVYSKN